MLEFILFVTRVTFFWLLLILLSAGSNFSSYNLVRRLKGCSTSTFVFVTHVTFVTVFMGYAGIMIYYW